MPKLIPNGPDIPSLLLQKEENGEVVFFCGAGISLYTGLPDFETLVKMIYAELRQSPDKEEARLLGTRSFDEVLGRLEKRLSDGVLRSAVAQIFASQPTPDSLALHEALLRLSRDSSELHLITTNFDSNFAIAVANYAPEVHVDSRQPDLTDWNNETSLVLVELILHTGNSFPSAVDWALNYLRSSKRHEICHIRYHKRAWESHSSAVLKLLNRIVPATDIDPFDSHALLAILESLKTMDSNITQSREFISLERTAYS